MKKNRFKFLSVSAVLVSLVLTPLFLVSSSQAQSEVKERKIVVFAVDKGLNEQAKEKIIKKSGGLEIKDLESINGKAVLLSQKAEKQLEKEADVLRIEDDIIVQALDKSVTVKAMDKGVDTNDYAITKKASNPSTPSQVLPWGIDRVDAEKVWNITNGDPIKVAVLDTGIDINHPDLKNNVKGGFNTITNNVNYNDDNGHGTHVAGIMAAENNTFGVVGVGPQIDLYAVKALNYRGSGYLSDILEGLDWVIANGMQIVNMSIGTKTYSQSFEDAIKRVNAAGIIQVAAAGNSGSGGNNVNYPAKFAEVIAVSATDITDKIAYFSSRGPEIDLAAPGYSVYSTYMGSTYKNLSGTSMASPHVAGAAALVLTMPTGNYDLNGNGIWDPIEVQNKLEATAKDLGTPGKDQLYGSGLLNVEKAIANSTSNLTETLDTIPPQISNVVASNISENAATIGWTTDEPATSLVEYGHTISYGLSTTLASNLVTAHSINLSGLEPGTIYHYRVKSKDAQNNETVSQDNTFTTTKLITPGEGGDSGTTPPQEAPLSITDISITKITQTSATIHWKTNKPTMSKIEYGLTTTYGRSAPFMYNYTTDHTRTISYLSAGVTYYYRLVNKDQLGNIVMSAGSSFTTNK